MTAAAQPKASRDPAQVQAYHDADAAMSMAKAIWREAGGIPPADVLQSTLATILIHIKDLRKNGSAPAPRAPARAAIARPQPVAQAQPLAAGAPLCPTCGGEAYDNRTSKKNPKSPDFRCKNKECLDDSGRQTAWWVEKKGQQRNTAFAQQAERPVPTRAADFEEMPEQLEEDDSLPF